MKNLHPSIPTNRTTTVNRCGYCGATSYHRVVARDEAGAMRYTETLQCTGCNRVFANLQIWRRGGEQESANAPIASAT